MVKKYKVRSGLRPISGPEGGYIVVRGPPELYCPMSTKSSDMVDEQLGRHTGRIGDRSDDAVTRVNTSYQQSDSVSFVRPELMLPAAMKFTETADFMRDMISSMKKWKWELSESFAMLGADTPPELEWLDAPALDVRIPIGMLCPG